jgi:hypothetical protein
VAELKAARIPATLEDGIAALLAEVRAAREPSDSHPVASTPEGVASADGSFTILTSKAM